MSRSILTFLGTATILAGMSAHSAAAQQAIAAASRSTPAPAPSAAVAPVSPAVAARAVDEALTRATAEGRFSGVVMLAKDGRPVFQRAYGMADRTRRIANTVDTRFNLGSMNKMFTAVAIAQLVAQGKLSYSDPVAKFIPDFPTRAAAEKIRVEHLLTHTSGLGSYFSPRFFRERPGNVAAMMAVAREDTALAFAPGTGWRYSNTDFLVLGAIIEKVTGQDYYDYVRDYVFAPAGMQASSWPTDAGSAPARALEYVTPGEPGGAWVADDFLRGSPAGGGVSTLADLLRFSQALLAGRLVPMEQVRLLTSPKPEVGSARYGYGFGTAPGPMHIVGHNGGKPGVFAQLDIYPEAGYITVLLMNQGNGEPQGESVELLRTAVRSMAGVAAPSAAAPLAMLPETPRGRAVAAMLETMRGGDTAAIRRFVAERMSARFTSRPMERNFALFQQMRGDLGDARVVSAQETDTGIRAVLASASGRFAMTVAVETAPPNRIAGLRVEAADDDAPGEAAPAASAAAAAGAQVTLPETPAGRAAAALLATVRGGDTAAIRRFVAERMDAEFQARPMERTQALFARMRGDFGQGRIVSAVPGENSLRLVLASDQGRFTIDLGVEAAPPHRISGLSVRAGGEGGDAAGAGAAAAGAPDAATRMAVVDSIGKLLERLYPSADTGRAIGQRLRERERAGAYAQAATLQAFADSVTADMRMVNGDRHLNVRVGGPRRRGGPGGAPAGGETYGIEASRVIEGGVGYLKLSGLSGHPDAPAALGRALAALGDIRAMIIDLRGAPGGSGEMANAVISHFTGPGIPSLRVVSRSEGTTEVRNTLATVAGPRRTEIPLYVLVDRGSASAAEDVPFVLQNLRRATIVGEVTAGAGRNNTILPVGAGLSASISMTRVSDPRTGREWELVGVKPDIETPSAGALEAALAAARARIAAPGRQ